MILAITLVFLIGGLIGWFYGQRRGHSELIELRRLKQISRIDTREQIRDTREQMRRSNSTEFPETNAVNNSNVDTVSKRSSTRSLSDNVSSGNLSSVSNGLTKTSSLAGAEAGDHDYDELYKIAGRVKPLEFDLKLAWQRVAELEKKSSRRIALDTTVVDKNEAHQNTASSLQSRLTVTDDSTSQHSASVPVGLNAAELDELYRVSARVKPLEYDLTQRKIEVKALKQALKDVRRINEKQLVSVRLQAENRSGLQYKEQLADQQKQIETLRTRLSNSLNRKSPILKPQLPLERVQAQELTAAKQQLVGTRENLAQSEKRVAELQKELAGVNQRLNSRSTELEAVQHDLKESNQRGSLLAGRIKLLDAKVQQIDVLNRKLHDRDHVAGTLTAQINKQQDEISKLETELQLKHKQIDAKNRALEKIPVLEASVLKSEQELIRVREQEPGEQVDSLQRALIEKDEHIVNLRKQSDRVLSLESAAKIRDTQIVQLSQRSERADELEQQLIEKDRKILSLRQLETKASDQERLITELKLENETAIADKKLLENRQLQLQQALTVANDSANELVHVRAELAKSKEAEIQLAQAQDKLIEAKHVKADLNRLQSVSIELENSRLEIENLCQSLKSAQSAVAAAKENDIEVRRLRSEMQSLQSVHDNSSSKVQSLEKKIREQERDIVTNNQLKARVQELESIQADNERRDQQINELKKRLRDLSKASSLKSDKPKKQAKKNKSRASRTPLYAAPEEKDDLKKINGIGPVMEKLLNSLGITSFKQVAEFKSDDISNVTDAIKAFPGRIERDDWVGGAKEQYAKKYHTTDA